MDTDYAGCFIGPDLGTNCLQMLSADDERFHWQVKELKSMFFFTINQKLLGNSDLIFYNIDSLILTLANSEDPDEMPHKVAFHQGLHCLLR